MSTPNVPLPILYFERSLEKIIAPKLRQCAGHGKIALNVTATVSIVNCREESEPDLRWWVIPKGAFLIPQRLLYSIHQHQEIPSEDPRVRGCHPSCLSGRIARRRIDNRDDFTPPDNHHHHPAVGGECKGRTTRSASGSRVRKSEGIGGRALKVPKTIAIDGPRGPPGRFSGSQW